MDTESLNCPNCGAVLQIEADNFVLTCAYCHSAIRVTTGGLGERLLAIERSQTSMTLLSPNSVEEIRQLLREGERLEALKLYRERTDANLGEAIEAVDEMAKGLGVPSGDVKVSWWPCLSIPLGFLVWMGIIVGGSFLVEKGLRALFHRSQFPGDTSAWIIFATACLLGILSLFSFSLWAKAGTSKKRRKKESAR